jgi:hypothetical protein
VALSVRDLKFWGAPENSWTIQKSPPSLCVCVCVREREIEGRGEIGKQGEVVCVNAREAYRGS